MALRPETHFLLRRLHSLSGVVPIGVFLCEHMVTNSFSRDPEKYNFIVTKLILGMPKPLFMGAELGVLLVPIAFHVLLGMVITRQGSVNQFQYTYSKNWAYLLQRVTGILTLIFLLTHVGSLRIPQIWNEEWAHMMHTDPYWATRTYFRDGGYALGGWYAIGVACASFHFGNGLWTFLVSWGIVIGRRTQAMAHMACLGVWLGVMGIGLFGLTGFYDGDISDKHERERDQASAAEGTEVHVPAGGEGSGH